MTYSCRISKAGSTFGRIGIPFPYGNESCPYPWATECCSETIRGSIGVKVQQNDRQWSFDAAFDLIGLRIDGGTFERPIRIMPKSGCAFPLDFQE